MNKICRVLLINLLVLTIFFLPPKTLYAEDTSVRVSGYQYGTSWLPLVKPNLDPPQSYPPNIYAYRLYQALENTSNFGLNGKVSCSVDFVSQVDYVYEGSLVNQDGSLNSDIFWGGSKLTALSDEEATELAMFVNNGGVLYISGRGWQDISTPGRGPEYNLLFEKLGIGDRFNTDAVLADEYTQTEAASDSIITRGPFGDVGSMLARSFRSFDNVELNGIVSKQGNNDYLVFEKKIGKGYLVVTGDYLYIDSSLSLDNDNLNYFLNLFALGCGEQDFGKYEATVLDVPSFKQRLTSWEGELYDTATSQPMWCGTTIGKCGCAMTSAAMAMVYKGLTLTPEGVNITPSSLNEYFSRDPVLVVKKRKDGTEFNTYNTKGYTWGDFAFDWVDDFSLLTHTGYPQQPKIDEAVVEVYNFEKVKQYIDNDMPVVLKVKTPDGSIHWVLVKGYMGEDLIINDPYYPDPSEGTYETLISRNYTIPSTESTMITYKTTESDFSSLVLKTSSPVHLLVTDEQGRRTGYAGTDTILEEIPNSTYYLSEFITPPDSTVVPPPGEGIYTLYIRVPENGKYRVELINPNNWPETYRLYASGIDGQNQTYHLTDDLITINYANNAIELPISIEARMEVRPFVQKNVIVPWSFGLIPVGIYSDDNLNIKNIKESSLRFGKTGDEKSLAFCVDIDLNKDKVKDKYCMFWSNKTGLERGDRIAYIQGQTKEGLPFTASDDVLIVGGGFFR